MILLRRITMGIYTTTYLLGFGIKRGWWHTRSFQWLHHTLFAAIWVSTIATAVVGWKQRVRYWFAPLSVLLWMAPLPRFRAGGTMHQTLATGGLFSLIAAHLLVAHPANTDTEEEHHGTL